MSLNLEKLSLEQIITETIEHRSYEILSKVKSRIEKEDNVEVRENITFYDGFENVIYPRLVPLPHLTNPPTIYRNSPPQVVQCHYIL